MCRNRNGCKSWKLFLNGEKTSPMSSICSHFKHEHYCEWCEECAWLEIYPNNKTEWMPDPGVETFAQEGFITWLLKFIIGDNQVHHQLLSVHSYLTCWIIQSINVVENPHFHELLWYIGQGNVTEDKIPGWTSVTRSIIMAWKGEQEELYQEMKVCWTPGLQLLPCVDLTLINRNP